MKNNESSQLSTDNDYISFSNFNPTKAPSPEKIKKESECTNNCEEIDSKQNNNESKSEMNIIYLHFFFDGTGNNKHNTNVRLGKLKDEQNVSFPINSQLSKDADLKGLYDSYAETANYKDFNVKFSHLHDKCYNYAKSKKCSYTDVFCYTEKALQNLERPPAKPKITGYDIDKTNQEQYIKANAPYQKGNKDLESNIDKYLNKYDDLSYYNYYSNIALLSDAIDTNNQKNHHVFYIGGAGTISFGKDIQDGAAFSQGETGAKERIKQTISELELYLKKTKTEFQEKIIYINLYGFSRGAFYARYFYSELQKILSSNYSTLDEFKFKFNLGIFLDTVSSEGFCHSNDIEEFNLDSTYDYMKIYHICAQDEFRYHFPLTNIKKCLENNKDSIEIILPGAHSDIGGGYGEVCDEIDKDLDYARLSDNENNRFGYVPFYWFVNKGYYQLDENGHFFNYDKIDNNHYYFNGYNLEDAKINGLLTVKDKKVRCIKRRVYYAYQFVIAKIMQKIMTDNFGDKILDENSEFNIQINNLQYWKIDDFNNGIKNLDEYANKIITWIPKKNTCGPNTLSEKQAKLQETNVFLPKEHGISESTMKYIYNNFIHNSLTNSTDNSDDMSNNQKRGFYIAYHAQISNYEPKTEKLSDDSFNDSHICNCIPILKNYKSSSSSMSLGAVEQEKIDTLNSYDELFLGTYNYNAIINNKFVKHSNVINTEGILEKLYKNNTNDKKQINYNDHPINIFDFYPIRRLQVDKYKENHILGLTDSKGGYGILNILPFV